MRSFTKFSEQSSTQEVVEFLNHYLSRLTNDRFKLYGTLINLSVM
nr:hypothetical protein [Leptospira terpstrae]